MLVMAGDNVLDFSLSQFVDFAKEKNTSCVMCHEENDLKKQQKTAIITLDNSDLITSYEDTERYIGRKADKNRKIYNGMIKTYFYQFMGPKPPRRKKD